MDEFDALVSSAGNTDQERRVSACLKSLFDDQLNSKNDDEHNKTIVIAVTSRPEFIDTSFRRSGRLEIEIELGVPDFKQRIEIVKAILERSGDLVTSRLNDNDIEFVSRNAHGYVGADLEAVLAQVSY
jgi:AAA family ATPase